MIIRKYFRKDLEQIVKLFYDTVHSVNAADYTPRQLDAWANGKPNLKEWADSLARHHSLVAEKGGTVVGFADMDESGYLDRLYVHKSFLRQGIAARLCDALESAAHAKKIVTHASVTAKPFFEARGYTTIRRQQVERNGVFLTNYVMEKTL